MAGSRWYAAVVLKNDKTRQTVRLSKEAANAFAKEIAKYTPAQKLEILAAIKEDRSNLSPELQHALQYSWPFFARPDQLPPEEGDWVVALALAGRGWGKLLTLSVKVPTPSGWTTMGDLQVGDTVFDESGRQCKVTATFEDTPEEAYRLHFSDGTSIEACSEHQWVTWTHAERKSFLRSPYEDTSQFPAEWPSWRLRRFHGFQKKSGDARLPQVYDDSPGPKVRTTKDIVDTFTTGKRGDLNHCIPVCGALQLPDADLPIDPYVLGVWLGDGNSGSPHVTIGDKDLEDSKRLLAERGIFLRDAPPKKGKNCRCYTMGFSGDKKGETTKLGPLLRKCGLLNNKHIPDIYLRSSIRQRLDLLKGLMDTDGYAEASKVVFVSVLPGLAAQVMELIRSLGQKPIMYEGRSKLYGVDHGPKFRIEWRPTIDCFGLKRKSSKFTKGGKQSLRNHHRMIVRAERIDPVPMKCITVDSPHSMYLAGEGMIPTHNTRALIEWLRMRLHAGAKNLIIAGATAESIRQVLIDGPSGLKAHSPEEEELDYQPSLARIVWKKFGAVALLLSAEEPDRARGPQSDTVIIDELASHKGANTQDINDANLMYNQLRLCCRLTTPSGLKPRLFAATTPRPTPLIRHMITDPKVYVIRGKTLDNSANLAPEYIDTIVSQYGGTRLGRQELDGELLDEAKNALWNRTIIEDNRIGVAGKRRAPPRNPEGFTEFYVRTVVAIDPAVSAKKGSDETGIIVAALGRDGHGYVLQDLSGRYTPDRWAQIALDAYRHHWADRIIAEKNNGGDLVEGNIRTRSPNIPFAAVHASKGKVARAEPVSALYEQQRVHHVGNLNSLEEQMVLWEPQSGQPSPDRLDALVWAISFLMLGGTRQPYRSMGTIEAI